jgi:protein-S-isoprenylcysteine O-methyltransferase Ste14
MAAETGRMDLLADHRCRDPVHDGPTALYFYSLYGPALSVLGCFSTTAWLTQFFLPHISTTQSPVLNTLPSMGTICAPVGTAWFLAAAGQLYWNKSRQKGLIVTGQYAFSRHPQYTAP